ncbi:hypothetical protein HRG_006345 [Hirsutella rhossiliensis]|uniref:Uncharacterized protein n=1 Tax=Hirsutella rhossiliensis TaxID=111463 RepID=A0A9P8MU98_9HYPO|nr:uncharacterized protein HRG_06345 [Hirsutella rhossiliensis]KAH0962243.1 hypothetical protein HRG_06345 [Hirsutella rhossiliensis]
MAPVPPVSGGRRGGQQSWSSAAWRPRARIPAFRSSGGCSFLIKPSKLPIWILAHCISSRALLGSATRRDALTIGGAPCTPAGRSHSEVDSVVEPPARPLYVATLPQRDASSPAFQDAGIMAFQFFNLLAQ